jgi:hypothetical protein
MFGGLIMAIGMPDLPDAGKEAGVSKAPTGEEAENTPERAARIHYFVITRPCQA